MRHLDSIYIHCTATRAEWWADRRSSEKAAYCKRKLLDGDFAAFRIKDQ